MRLILSFFIILLATTSAFATPVKLEAPVKSYADIAYKSYHLAYADALALQTAINNYLADSSEPNRKAARDSWLKLRGTYAQTEIFRFFDSPADSLQPELNQWPINHDFINNLLDDDKFEITSENLLARNQEFDEEQVTTGLNVIEFFLWKKSMSTDREKEYLRVITELAATDLKSMQDAWEPAKENYAKEFLAEDTQESLRKMLLGITVLSGFELAANRIGNHDEKSDYSSLSENTRAEFSNAMQGIRHAYFDTGMNLLVEDADKALAERISTQIGQSEKLVATPLTNEAARKALVDSLQIEAGLFKQAAGKMNLSIDNVAE